MASAPSWRRWIRRTIYREKVAGAGGAFRRSVRYTAELGREVGEVAYLGDLDPAGVRIAADAARIAAARGLPPVRAFAHGHRAMLGAARRFGHAKGWPRRSRPGRELVEELEFLPRDVRDEVKAIFNPAPGSTPAGSTPGSVSRDHVSGGVRTSSVASAHSAAFAL